MAMIAEWFGFGIMPLICNMEVNPMLPSVAVARLAGVDWAELPN